MNEFMYTVVAMAGGGGGQAGDPIMGFLVPMALVFGIMYVLVIRPQQQKQKEHEDYVSAFKSGDKVVTQGGIFGRVTAVSDRHITLDIGDRTRIKVLRTHILGSQEAVLSAESDGGDKKKDGDSKGSKGNDSKDD
ncbi:MAG: preprotein translocase subunit YajC [Myxococcota bacterium]